MTRIYFEYAKNAFLTYPDYFMFVLFVVISFVLVSIRDVLNNIPKDSLSGAFNFFILAIRNTSLALQILIMGFFVRVGVSSTILAYKNGTLGIKWFMSKFSKV